MFEALEAFNYATLMWELTLNRQKIATYTQLGKEIREQMDLMSKQLSKTEKAACERWKKEHGEKMAHLYSCGEVSIPDSS